MGAKLTFLVMIQTEFSAALNQVCSEKGLNIEAVLETIKAALLSAYRKESGSGVEEVTVEINPESGETHIIKEGEDVTPPGFGRIASQTAKQVLIQRLREAEKDALVDEYGRKVDSIVSGHIFRIERGTVVLDLGKAHALLPQNEQIGTEQYFLNQRLRVLVKEIRKGEKGPEIIVSRGDPKFIISLFNLEVPELTSGVVEIKAIAREAGGRTKIAVSSSDPRVDPVGSCVGQKGVRVQSVLSEIKDEKIDIVPFDEDTAKFIANALSPAKIKGVELNKKKKEAEVGVCEDQVSLAIGKEGQNVRLAVKLTGWKIDIHSEREKPSTEGLAILGISSRYANILANAGVTTLEQLRSLTPEKVKEIKGLGPKALKEVEAYFRKEEPTTNPFKDTQSKSQGTTEKSGESV